MDYSALKGEILEKLFLNRSTLDLSRELGYAFDQVRRWSSGRKELRWSEFCVLCERVGRPLTPSLREVFQFAPKDPNDWSGAFLHHFRELYLVGSLRDLSEKLDINLSVLRRFFSGEVSPPLELVLAILDQRPMLLGAFLRHWTQGMDRGPLLNALSEGQVPADLVTAYPLASAIEGLLQVQEYKALPTHDEEWMITKLGASRGEFRETWEALRRAGQVFLDGSGKFRVNPKTIFTNGVSAENVCRMVRYWNERASERFSSPDHIPVNRHGGPSIVAYRIVPMSRGVAEQATEIMIKAYSEILALAEASTAPSEDVRVFLFHHFSVEDHLPKPQVRQASWPAAAPEAHAH